MLEGTDPDRALWAIPFFSDIRSDRERWFASTFGITPHLEKYIELKERIKVISGVKFRPYRHNLRYPANKKGLDFLFDCLSDVDEAYFMPAAGVLSEVPVSALGPLMEKRSREAYLRCDVMRLAGIMYLAKETGYEIQFVKNLKEHLAGLEPAPVTEVDENGVVRFAPKQDEQSMAKEAVAFKTTP